nr:class I SAM-dependent methyltransferase [uncultured Methanospirillum sp.]
MKCRHCGEELKTTLIDLGNSPPSNAYLKRENLNYAEKWFPLRVMVCNYCWLVQTEEQTTSEDLFTAEYAYFSSYSSTWLAHAEKYVLEMINRINLNNSSLVIEIAANDGYLLQYLHQRDIPCFGIEPTHSTATSARSKGLEIIEEFFNSHLAERLIYENKKADLIIANNVLAHIPNINDFVSGISKLLKPGGVATFEFPHLFQLILNNQFDTIYHEHFSYLSLTSVVKIFYDNGLTIFDVDELSTHGGSLRVFAGLNSPKICINSEKVNLILKKEEKAGMKNIDYYLQFQKNVNQVKNEFLIFLLNAKKDQRKVIGYGAAAKGNTLINYAGVKSDLISYVVDRNEVKIGKFLPGSHIPIMDEKMIRKDKPDYIIIFPWNIKEEIINQLSYIKEWGGKFVIAIPKLVVQ